MGNIQIHFTETFNTFPLLTIYGFNDLKLSSVEVYYYQTCKFVFLGENIRHNELKTIVLKKTQKLSFLSYNFFEGNKFICLVIIFLLKNEDKWTLNLLNIINSLLRVFLSLKAFNTFVGFTVSQIIKSVIVRAGFLLKHIKVSAGKQVTVNF